MHVFIDRKYGLIDFLSLPIYCVRFKRNIQSLPAMIAGISHIADDINVQRQIILDKAEKNSSGGNKIYSNDFVHLLFNS